MSSAPAATVVAALHSPGALQTAIAAIGRRPLLLAGETDLVQSLDQAGARALLFELGHPGFISLSTRFAVTGCPLPMIVIVPPGRLPTTQLMVLSRVSTYALAYDHREVGSVLRRCMQSETVASDAWSLARGFASRLRPEASLLALGLYVMGASNMPINAARDRLGVAASFRNRLRSLGLPRAATMLGWSCALGIVWRMEHDGDSLMEAARYLGFETTRQCSDRVLYHTGRTPTALRNHGFAHLAEEFIDRVQSFRFPVGARCILPVERLHSSRISI